MVSVDTVYQRILAILNKENRGYMTPQEYNLLANQAQLEIFEQYFYDLNQFNRRGEINNEFANPIKNIKEKINIFKIDNLSLSYSISGSNFELPENLYRLGTVIYNLETEIEEVQKNEFLYINASPLTKPSTDFPIYTRSENTIKIYPATITQYISISYIRKIKEAKWTYEDINDVALYNPTASDHNDFELHPSEETNLVNKILGYAGIVIKQPDVFNAAEAKDNKKITQEKS